jgi:hypothetical protein
MLKFLSALFALNPTRQWQENPSIPLILDLDQHQFCQLKIGDTFEKLSFLGSARRNSLFKDWFEFSSKGITVSVVEAHIEWFAFFIQPDPEISMAHFEGAFQYQKQILPFSQIASEKEIRRQFGEPYWKDQDSDEILLFYEFPHCEWQIELSLEGQLKAISISKPILADPEQRKAYHVTNEWPPSHLSV